MNHIRRALFFTTVVSLSMAVLWFYTYIFSNNGGLNRPIYSRLADINYYHEAIPEGLIFLTIGIYGLYVLKYKVIVEESK